MKPLVSQGNKKSTIQPVIITNDTKFIPNISKRRKQEFDTEDFVYDDLDRCGIVCLYIFLVLCILIGGGGIAVCIIYFNSEENTQNWKIGGIVLSALTCIIGIILIIFNACKQTRNRPWRIKSEEIFINDDVNKLNIEEFDDDDQLEDNIIIRKTNKSETASSPIPNSFYPPLKKYENDLMYCPGCNRLHPITHKCLYLTCIVNNFSMPFKSQQDSIGIQTDENSKIKSNSHTIIDRSIKYSITTETQTDISTKPKSNITESIILRRVPIPTTKVTLKQPTTKIMILRVPNTAGELVIQPKKNSC